MLSDIWLRLGLPLLPAASSIILTLSIPKASAVPALWLRLPHFPRSPHPHCCSWERQNLSRDSFRFSNPLVVLLSPSGKFTRRGSSDAATEMESLSARHSHSHHTLVSDLPDHSDSHGENTVKEGGSEAAPAGGSSGSFSCFLFLLHVPFSLCCGSLCFLDTGICVLHCMVVYL